MNTRQSGSLVAWEAGTTTAYALKSAEERGVLFYGPGVDVYEGTCHLLLKEPARAVTHLEQAATALKNDQSNTNVALAARPGAVLHPSPNSPAPKTPKPPPARATPPACPPRRTRH